MSPAMHLVSFGARGAVRGSSSLALSVLEVSLQVLEGRPQAVELIHEMQDHVDALVIDAEIRFQIADEAGSRDIHV